MRTPRQKKHPSAPPALDGPVALRVDRDAALLGATRVEDMPALLFALESSVVDLDVAGAAQKLDRATFALVPAGLAYELAAVGETVKLATLVVDDPALERLREEYDPHIGGPALGAVLAVPRVLPRTRWVDELVHRYVFERVQCERHQSSAARFLETELLKELFFLAREHDDAQTRSSAVHDEDAIAKRAREWIESHVFEPLRMAELVRHAGASESSVLRAFRREHGVAPREFHQGRRLDEARILVASGRYQVAEVAGRVGYASIPSFTTAFKKRFGAPPSGVLEPRGKAPRARLEPVPPQGAATTRRRRGA